MLSNYPEGSMHGSGIYSREVEYDEFTCDNEECEKVNKSGIVVTDDWGTYKVSCEFCDAVFLDSSISDDAESAYIDAMYDAYKERDL